MIFKVSKEYIQLINGVLQSFVEEGKDVEIKGLQVALAVQDTKEIKVTLEAGNQAQLDAYNAKNGTNYIVLPKEMYEISQKINIYASLCNDGCSYFL